MGTRPALPDYDAATMVLICPDNTRCGFYSGGCLWIDPPHRGRRLGAELVLAMTEALQDSPTAYHDGLGFTQAGLDSHFTAWVNAAVRAHDVGQIPEHHVLEQALASAGRSDHFPSP